MPRYQRQTRDGGIVPTIGAPDLSAATELLDFASKRLAEAGVNDEAALADAEGRDPQYSWIERGLAPQAIKKAEDERQNALVNETALELEEIRNVAQFPDGTTIDEANAIARGGLAALDKVLERQGLSLEAKQRLAITVEREKGRIRRGADVSILREERRIANGTRTLAVVNQDRVLKTAAYDDPTSLVGKRREFEQMSVSQDEEERAYGLAGMRSIGAYSQTALSRFGEVIFDQGGGAGKAKSGIAKLAHDLGMSEAEAIVAYEEALTSGARRDGLDLAIPASVIGADKARMQVEQATKRANELGLTEEGRERNLFINQFVAASDQIAIAPRDVILARANARSRFNELRAEYLTARRQETGNAGYALTEADLDGLQVLWYAQKGEVVSEVFGDAFGDPYAEFDRFVKSESSGFMLSVAAPPKPEKGSAVEALRRMRGQ